jgi:uncharacterized ferredoxin-like protein
MMSRHLILAADAAPRTHGALILHAQAETTRRQSARLIGPPAARPQGVSCRWCGQQLHHPASIEQGAGPVCRARHEGVTA